MGLAVSLTHRLAMRKTKAELVIVDGAHREALHGHWLMVELGLDIYVKV